MKLFGRILCLLLLLSLFSFQLSCRTGSPKSCSAWIKKLHNPARARDAIRNLGDLKCKEGLSALESLIDEGQYISEILGAVKQINEPRASVSILRKSLASLESGPTAASIIEDWKLADLKNDLVEILKSEKNPKLKKPVLKALLAMEDYAPYEDLFIKLLTDDPNTQGIGVNILAAEALGKLRSAKAIESLIIGLFVQTQKGEKMYVPCRKAMVNIGAPAVEPLISTLKGNNEKLAAYAKKIGLYDWQWIDGPEIVQVLSDIRDPRIVVPLVEAMGKSLEPPSGDDRVLEVWKVTEQNRITMSMLALANVGDDVIVPKAVEIITTANNDAKQRLDTASTLALIGTTKSVNALFDIYKKEKDDRFKSPLLLPLAIALDNAHYKDFVAMTSKEKSPLIKERLEGNEPESVEVRDHISVVKECEANADCYLKKFEEGNTTQKKKASLILTHLALNGAMDKTKVLVTFFTQFPKIKPTEVDLRRFILIGISKLGNKNNVADVEKLIKSDKEQKGAGFWIDELEMMIPALRNKI
jgi:HEAT repeat protein